ncbi:hypothetical protein [Planococcus sp. MB-3u-03]|nr:hypothetical protein [Planococcus sp. MB-3u-03]
MDTQIQLLEAMLDGSKVGTIVTDPEKKTTRSFTQTTHLRK